MLLLTAILSCWTIHISMHAVFQVSYTHRCPWSIFPRSFLDIQDQIVVSGSPFGPLSPRLFSRKSLRSVVCHVLDRMVGICPQMRVFAMVSVPGSQSENSKLLPIGSMVHSFRQHATIFFVPFHNPTLRFSYLKSFQRSYRGCTGCQPTWLAPDLA